MEGAIKTDDLPASTLIPASVIDDTNRKIVDAYLVYVERNQVPNYTEIQRAVWGTDDKAGGAHFNQVKKVIAEFEGVSVDELAALSMKRVTTTGPVGDSGSVAA